MKTYHSRAYHRFFEGYTEEKTMDETGKIRITYVYTGEYYEPVRTREQYVKDKIWTTCMSVLAAALFVFAGTRNVPANTQAAVAGLQAAFLLFFFLTAKSIFYLLTSRTPYTIRIYRIVSEKLIQNVKRAAVCCWLTAAAVAVYMCWSALVGLWTFPLETFICIAAESLGGGILYAVYRKTVEVEFKSRKEYGNGNNSCRGRCGADHPACGDISAGAIH